MTLCPLQEAIEQKLFPTPSVLQEALAQYDEEVPPDEGAVGPAPSLQQSTHMQEYSEEGVVEALTLVRAKGFDLGSRVRAVAKGEESGESVFTVSSTSQTSVQLTSVKSDNEAGVRQWVDVQHFLTAYVLAEEPDGEQAPYCF